MTQINRKYGSMEGKIQTVDLAALHIDPSYQRDVKRHHRRIQGDFRPAAAGTLTVGARPDNTLWCIDGLQRMTAMLKLGITKWKATVVHSDGPVFEAALFGLLNDPRNRKGLQARDLFKSKLTAGDPIATGIKDILEEAGIRLCLTGGQKEWPEIAAAGTLYKETERYGLDVMKRSARVIVEAFYQQREGLSDLIAGTILQIVGVNKDLIDDTRLIKQLKRTSAHKLMVDAKSAAYGSIRARCVRLVAELYNLRLSPDKCIQASNSPHKSMLDHDTEQLQNK